MASELCNSTLALGKVVGLNYRDDVEVWAHDRDKNEKHYAVVLVTNGAEYTDLLPNEARALAALLIAAAEAQERRAALNIHQHGEGENNVS